MTISKDESIVNQVAAKIAADLVNKEQPLESVLDDFKTAYTAVYEKMSEFHGFGQQPAYDGAARLQQAFPGSTEVPFTEADMTYPKGNAPQAAQGGIRIKGTQHGPLPEWLFAAAAEAGITEVYDNRDGLAENASRPWFKATTGGRDAKAFWPPRAGKK